MNRTIFVSAFAGLVLTAFGADAQLLGGRGGIGIGGGVMGSVPTTFGRVDGAVDGRVSTSPAAHARPRIKAPKAAAVAAGRGAALDARAAGGLAGLLDGAAGGATAVGSVAVGGSGAVALPNARAAVVGAPPVRLGYIGGPRVVVIGRRQALIDDGVEYVPAAEAPAYIDRQEAVLDRELAGTGVEVHRRGKQLIIEMPSDVTFAFDKYDIQPRFFPVLGAVGRTISRFPATYVDVVGHTDAVGSYAYNQALSERRASSVADFLVREDAQPDRLYVEGRGKTEPIASNATIEGRAANRRVEIILSPFEGPA